MGGKRGGALLALALAWAAMPAAAAEPKGLDIASGRGWRAKLFVSAEVPKVTTVGANFSLRLSRSTRLTLEGYNVLDKRSPDPDPWRAFSAAPTVPEAPLAAEGRGIRLSITRRF